MVRQHERRRIKWVDRQVSDGTDLVEHAQLLNHLALGVKHVQVAHNKPVVLGFQATEKPKIGRDGKWHLNLGEAAPAALKSVRNKVGIIVMFRSLFALLSNENNSAMIRLNRS